MESHGANPRQSVVAVIPARYSSVRLPGKLLLPIAGRPLVVHTLQRTAAAANIDRAVVATDDERIAEAVREAGGEVVMTSAEHPSGSDRVAEVAKALPDGTIVVNVQGDEPLISPRTIEIAVEALLSDPELDFATTCEAIREPADVLDPNVVKVVTDAAGNALYFSRSPIPFVRDIGAEGSLEAALRNDPVLLGLFRKHTGLYAYRREALLEFSGRPPAGLEKAEKLEQLRILASGRKIRVAEAHEASIGVDTVADYERVKALVEGTKVGV